MHSHIIDLKPVDWRSAIGRSDRSSYRLIQARSSLTGRDPQLYLKGLPEPLTDPVNVAIFRETYRPLREEVPGLVTERYEDPIEKLMRPSEGGNSPLGVISYITDGPWFDVRLYPGSEIFDDLWIRLQQNSFPSSLITLTIYGVEFGERDKVIWDAETYRWLPIQSFRFEASLDERS